MKFVQCICYLYAISPKQGQKALFFACNNNNKKNKKTTFIDIIYCLPSFHTLLEYTYFTCVFKRY